MAELKYLFHIVLQDEHMILGAISRWWMIIVSLPDILRQLRDQKLNHLN